MSACQPVRPFELWDLQCPWLFVSVSLSIFSYEPATQPFLSNYHITSLLWCTVFHQLQFFVLLCLIGVRLQPICGLTLDCIEWAEAFHWEEASVDKGSIRAAMSKHTKGQTFYQSGLAVCGDWISFASGGGGGVGTERAHSSGTSAGKKILSLLQNRRWTHTDESVSYRDAANDYVLDVGFIILLDEPRNGSNNARPLYSLFSSTIRLRCNCGRADSNIGISWGMGSWDMDMLTPGNQNISFCNRVFEPQKYNRNDKIVFSNLLITHLRLKKSVLHAQLNA